jgi:putative hemolysin
MGRPAEARRKARRRTLLIDGMFGLDELKQVLGVSSLPGEDADWHTLGGYVMARLNRIPMVADRVSAAGYRFEVVKMDGRRVDRVLISPVKEKSRRGAKSWAAAAPREGRK